MVKKIAMLGIALILAACGTVASPVYEHPTEEVIAHATSTVAQVAAVHTVTPVPPTATPVPATTTTEPTVIPTEEATPEAAAVTDDKEFFVQLASASNGAALFRETITTAQGVPWACSTCHSTEPDLVLIGPSQHGVLERAKTRIAGMGPYTYLYNSILHSQDYLVPEFAAEGQVRMPDYAGVLSDAQVYDLMAYLVTLE